MEAWLENQNGGRFPVNGCCAIGRLAGSTVPLDDRQVSRRHALIFTDAAGHHWLVDFGSSNGTRLNGMIVAEPRRLKPGDVIEISSHKLLFNQKPDTARSTKTSIWEETEKKFPAIHATRQGVMVLDASGAVLTVSPHARKWLALYFKNRAKDNGPLPDELLAWLRQQSGGSPVKTSIVRLGKPLVLVRGEKRLRVQLTDVGREQQVLLFSEEDFSAAQSRLKYLGLTKRESQVMLWLAEGKTNTEISTILKTSPRTVEKQVASILLKLNVENRVTAVIRAMEFCAAKNAAS